MSLYGWSRSMPQFCGAAYFGNRLFMYFPDPTRVAPEAAGLNGVREIELRGRRWHHTDCLACTGEGRQTDHKYISMGEWSKRRQPRTQNSKNSGARLRCFLSQQPWLWRIRRTAYGERQCRRRDRGLRSPERTWCAGNQDRGLRRVVRLWPGGAARCGKAGRRGRAGSPAYLDDRCRHGGPIFGCRLVC